MIPSPISLLRLLLIFPLLAVLTAAAKPPPDMAAITCLHTQSDPCYLPSSIRSLYEASPLYTKGVDGRGKTIAVIVSFGDPTIRSDLAKFDAQFGLPNPRLTIRTPTGKITKSDSGWRAETALDVEWSHVMAPRARILLMESNVNETEGTHGLPQFLKLEKYAVAHGADVVSQSWAATEDTLFTKAGRALVKKFNAFYAAATKKGVTFVGASGDDGTAGYNLSVKQYYPFRVVQWPASNPHVLAVGGTVILPGTPRREDAWPGSGGGVSKFYSTPCYQERLPAATLHKLAGRRGLPDVAFDAAPATGVAGVVDNQWVRLSGTSFATPAWAGIIAMADQVAHRDLGDVHGTIYRLGTSASAARDFLDITQGNLQDPSQIQGQVAPLGATDGWDFATGFGTPNVDTLVHNLAATKQSSC